MAVVCVPSKATVKVIKQCAEKGIKGIMLITAGFKEIGEEGKKLEDEIISIANKYDIALIGRITGQTILQTDNFTDKLTVDVKNIPPGLYIMEVLDTKTDNRITKKIVTSK